MKKKLSYISLFFFITALFTTFSTISATVREMPATFTYGESLNDSQYQETKNVLGVESGATEIEVQINELNSLLQDNYNYYQVYSSSYITPNSNGGINVDIVTPNTITTITPLQYENAALTAGATDVNIKVGSAVTVDGSGALAGVYKTFQDAGYALDNQAVETAQEELAVTGQITEENQNESGYTDEALNAAIADMKVQVQQLNEETNNSVTIEQIQVIVNNVVNNYQLNAYLTEDNIQQLTNLMHQFSQINLTQEQKDAIYAFGQDIVNNSQNLFDQAQTAWNNIDDTQKQDLTEQATSIWEQIKQFFADLFASF
ncbi:DUF1002 domain-containing protein [Aerococcaceae bacterium DSM 111176]|nr:DUF1002 domain-containing protein [Aerococcaceae bacterium DSM 111176]